VNHSSDLDRPAVVMAVAATGTAAVLVFALLPIIVGALAEQYQLNDLQAGSVASYYFSIYAVIALTSALWVRRLSWVWAVRVGYLAMLLGLLVMWQAADFATVKIALCIIGVGAGLLFPISLTLASDMVHTDRTYSIKLCVEQLVPAAALILLSTVLLEYSSFSFIVLVLIGTLVLCFLASQAMPAKGSSPAQDGGGGNTSAVLGYLSLLALACGFASFAGLWAFFELIADENDFAPGFTTTCLAVGLVTSGVGPMIAAVVGDRFGRILPVLGANGVAVLTLWFLLGDVTTTAYALVLLLLPLFYYFGLSYIFAVVAEADHNRKVAGLMSFALAVGAASGPLIFGWLRSTDGQALPVMGLLMVGGAVLAAWIQSRLNGFRDNFSELP
jgi:predicted MFS family arabinose efflux permease